MTLAIAHGETVEPPPYASLRDAIVGAVELMPDGEFIHAKANAQHLISTYQETLEKAANLASGLIERGMRPGDGLIIDLRNSEDFVPTLWAAVFGGFVAAPLAQHLRRRLGERGPEEILAFVRAALKRATLITDDLRLSKNAPVEAIVLDEFASRTGDRRNVPSGFSSGGEKLCLAVPTSGATGRPKMVGLGESAVLARWWPKVPDAENASTFLSWSPYDHVMGLGLAAPNLRRKVHLEAANFVADPLLWLDLMDETHATHATMTSFGLSLVIDAVQANPERSWRLGHVRKIGVGAEPVSPKLCRRFFERLSPFGLRGDAIILGYGLTECGPVVGGGTAFSPDATPADDGRILLDRPTAGHAVRVVGEDGQILKEDCVGAIEVRGPTMTSGYIGDPLETDRLFTDDGWLRTGDLGVLENGRLAVIGREKELIVVNARKYSCQEIEEAIKRRSEFVEAYAAPLDSAVSSPDPGRGKPFAVFVAVDDVHDFALADVAAEVRGILASAYRFAPEAVALIDRRDVPRTPLGKVRRLHLAAMIGQAQFEKHVHRLNSQPPPLAYRRGDGEIEATVAATWARLLNCPEDFDRGADFFAVGGDSVLALQLSLSLEQKFGFPIPFEEFAERVSVFEVAKYIAGRTGRAPAHVGPPASLKPTGDDNALPDSIAARLRSLLRPWPGTPIGDGRFIRRVGTAQKGIPVFWCLQAAWEVEQLAAIVGARRPAFAMRSGYLLVDYGTPAAKALARRYVEEIKEAFPDGPYVIAGNCQGAIVALDVARQLLREGRKVQMLVVVDTPPFELFQNAPFGAPVAAYVANRSKFNPYRKYRFPAHGLKKLLPAGCRMTVISAEYTEIMRGDAFAQLSADLEEAIAWSDQISPPPSGVNPGAYPNSAYHNRIAARTSQLTLAPGETADLNLDLHNDGPTDWEAFESSGITVGNHWLSLDGEMLTWSDGRTPLTETIAAARGGTATLKITAPPTSGRYILEVDLIEEGVKWFGEMASAPLHIPVVVREAPSPATSPTPGEAAKEPNPTGLEAAIRRIRGDIRASPLPGWRKLWAKAALSLTKRAIGM